MNWDTIREIFNAALDLPESERDAYIRVASQGSDEMYSAVNSLLETDRDLGDFLSEPLGRLSPAPMPIQPGQLLCRRFRIQRLIGEGGMGYVYEAFDSELGRAIAIKVIRPEIAHNPDALKRFRREANVTLLLTHPNICRTFDIERDTIVADESRGTTTEVLFLTMELLNGETLAARITRNGPLPLDEALLLAIQMADALTCSHNLHVCHRDIKPANVMLVPLASNTGSFDNAVTASQTRAVLTDFGLATQRALFRVDDLSGFSQPGIPVGTLAYMAPEQLEGKPATAATDIYSLGLVLSEMVTGQRVFPSGNPLSNFAERLTAPPPSPRHSHPDLPKAWCEAIEGCLRTDPASRYQSAAEVIAVLQGGHTVLPILKFPAPQLHLPRVSLPTWSPQRKLILSIFSLLIVSLLAWGMRLYITKDDPKVDPGTLVYMTQIKNQSDNKSFDNLSELMQAGLTQSAHINLLDQGRVGDILEQMTKTPDTVIIEPTAREIAMRSGARRVIFATVTGHNGSYSLNIDIQKPDNTPTRFFNHWQKSFSWQSQSSTNSGTIPAELLTAIRTGTDWIRKEAGESSNDIAQLDTPPEDVTTSSWEALAAYSKAEHLNRERKQEEAIHSLKEAVQADPQFALSYARLGDIEVSIGRTTEGYQAYEMGLKTDFQRRLTRRELDRIRGIYASDTWDYEAAESAFRDYTIYYEHDYMGWFYRGLPLMRLGRYDEAIATLERAYQLDSQKVFAPFDLAICYILKGDTASAQHWIQILQQLSDNDAVATLQGILAFLAGHADDAEKQFSFASNSHSFSSRAKAIAILIRCAAERSLYPQAIQLIRQGINEATERGDQSEIARFMMDKAQIECEMGELHPCIAGVQLALSNDNSPESLIFASDIFGQLLTQKSNQSSGLLNSTLDQILRKCRATENNNKTAYQQAQSRIEIDLLLAQGNWRKAISKSQEASTQDTQFKRREYLGRALYFAAEHTTDSKERRALLLEARDAFSQTALHPQAIWVQSSLYLPGAFAHDLAAYMQISNQLNDHNRDSSIPQSLLSTLQMPKSQNARLQAGYKINPPIH